MVIIIDNYDSFTYNLFQQVEGLGVRTKVFKNDEISTTKIEKLRPSKIIISPGPGRPEDAGVSLEVIQKFYTKLPILGVCLGHQCIGQNFGSKITRSREILHGKTAEIYHMENRLFQGLRNPFLAARYHSLKIESLPKNFSLTAWGKKNEIMAIQHKKYPLYGVQFHPESFLTEEGTRLMYNFLHESC